jgi:hypothetical protein
MKAKKKDSLLFAMLQPLHRNSGRPKAKESRIGSRHVVPGLIERMDLKESEADSEQSPSSAFSHN